MPANWKAHQWPQDWKRSVFIPTEEQCQRCHRVAHISQASKVVLKTLQARLSQLVNQEFLDIQFGFRKGSGTRDQIAKTSAGS